MGLNEKENRSMSTPPNAEGPAAADRASCGCPAADCPMRRVAWGLLLLLIVLHQDFWNWTDGTLLFGIAPIGLVYHVGLSLVAGLVWWLVVRSAWPRNLLSASGDRPQQESDA